MIGLIIVGGICVLCYRRYLYWNNEIRKMIEQEIEQNQKDEEDVQTIFTFK